MNKPTASLVNAAFLNDAMSAASSRGMPGIRAVAESVPCECIVEGQIEPSIEAVMDEIVAALSRPLTVQEQNPAKEVEKPPRIAFKGDLQEVNRFFYKRGWTDGLPIMPPTQEAVAEMLTGTDLPTDHVIAKMIPRLGKATIEKIAINAVMAGCLPTYMPVLIAGVKAAMRPEVRLTAWGVSTGGFSPFWIINGPVRHDLNINSGLGVLNPGDIANAAIGRAMGLIIKNIGGARKGIEDMATFGHSGKYTMVIAENEEANPWEPLHVEAGFEKEDSAITLSFISSYSQFLGYGTDDKGIMRAMVYNLAPAHGGMGGLLWFMLKPIAAEFLAKGGWTKKEMADFISEHARSEFYRMPQYYRVAADPTEQPGPRERLSLLNTGDSMSITGNWPGRIHFVVAGGVGGPAVAMIRGGRHDKVTQKIELPANWGQLINKYKDIIPTYVRY
jgi:hypothetical protein